MMTPRADSSTEHPRPFRAALVQTRVEDGEPHRNFDRVVGLVRESPPADLWVLPELWTTGYAHDSWQATAESFTPEAVERLGELAAERSAWIAGSMVSLDDGGRLVNRLWVQGPGGERTTYDKAHLFGPMGEPQRMAPGMGRVSFALFGWSVAPSICFDLRFPEMYRLDALDGANLFLVVSAWPHVRSEVFDTLCRARAIENQAYVVACNRTGDGTDGTAFAGRSAVVAPDGTIVGRMDREDAVRHLELDPSVLETVRRTPHLGLRRKGIDWRDGSPAADTTAELEHPSTSATPS
jgi:predicted amidohydrolase